MGMFFYGNTGTAITFPDRILAHLRVVMSTKLRRSESFTLGWQHDLSDPTGRSTIWIHESMPLRFVFDSNVEEPLDSELLHQLAAEASSTAGILVTEDMLAGVAQD